MTANNIQRQKTTLCRIGLVVDSFFQRLFVAALLGGGFTILGLVALGVYSAIGHEQLARAEYIFSILFAFKNSLVLGAALVCGLYFCLEAVLLFLKIIFQNVESHKQNYENNDDS